MQRADRLAVAWPIWLNQAFQRLQDGGFIVPFMPILIFAAAAMLPSTVCGAGRAWEGVNPFFQPVQTTDYYGSGDVDLDGRVTNHDAEQVRQIFAAQRQANIRADVDGNGRIDAQDAEQIELALNHGTLPGWWNRLASVTARRDWIRRMLARDMGDQHPYTTAWQQCVGFSTQLFLRFASYQGDLYATDFGAGQTVYNLPLYCVSVMADNVAHSVNAILIGDNPLHFEDWMIIEPQTDQEMSPGNRLLPIGAKITIYVPRHIQATGHSKLNRVSFELKASGPQFLEHSPDLVLSRPPLPEEAPSNSVNLWEPILLPFGSGQLLVEKAREDLNRAPDLHLIDNWMVPAPSAQPLVGDSQPSRPLAITPLGSGECLVIWKGQPGYTRSLMAGVLDPHQKILQKRNVVAENRSVFSARLARWNEQTHLVWLELKLNTTHPHESGLYWSVNSGTGWTVPKRLVEVGQDVSSWHFEELPDARRYFFDLSARGKDELILVWARRSNLFGNVQITERRYQADWSQPQVIAECPFPTVGLDLLEDLEGKVHLAHWSGRFQQSGQDGRGPLYHRVLTPQGWSKELSIDNAGNSLCPQLFVKADGRIGVVYDKKSGAFSQPAWSEYFNEAWTVPKLLPVRTGFDIRYPSAVRLDNGLIWIGWAEQSPARAGYGCQYLKPSTATSSEITPLMRIQWSTTPLLIWNSIPGRYYTLQHAESLLQPSWRALSQQLLAQDSITSVTVSSSRDASAHFYRLQTE